MKSRRKRPKQKTSASKGRVPGNKVDDGVVVISKEWSELEQRGDLYRVAQLRIECRKLMADRENTWKELEQLGNWAFMDKFAVRMHHAGKSFTKHFERKLALVDQRRIKLDRKIRETIQKILDLDGSFVSPERGTGKKTEVRGSARVFNLNPRTGSDAAYRDALIRQYANLSNEDICGKLDLALGQSAAAARGLPERWAHKFGLNSYQDAYKDLRTKNLVQKLISKAKENI